MTRLGVNVKAFYLLLHLSLRTLYCAHTLTCKSTQGYGTGVIAWIVDQIRAMGQV